MKTPTSRARCAFRLLLKLYPAAFRAQLGESMAQALEDLWRERSHSRAAALWFLWVCADTVSGAVLERLRPWRETLHRWFSGDARRAALASGAVLAPFLAMELALARSWTPGGTAVLFGALFLAGLGSLACFLPAVRSVRSNHLMTLAVHGHWVSFAASLAGAVLLLVSALALGFLWLQVLLDQLPCFAGRPNCD